MSSDKSVYRTRSSIWQTLKLSLQNEQCFTLNGRDRLDPLNFTEWLIICIAMPRPSLKRFLARFLLTHHNATKATSWSISIFLWLGSNIKRHQYSRSRMVPVWGLSVSVPLIAVPVPETSKLLNGSLTRTLKGQLPGNGTKHLLRHRPISHSDFIGCIEKHKRPVIDLATCLNS